MMEPSSDIAFSPSVKAVQARRGSRHAYAAMEARGGFRTTLTPDVVAFIAEVDTAYLATASADGQPYAQHRGGPPGFIKVLGEDTLGFADFTGNRQYITTGNLEENDRAFLFLMDYAHARRIKLWGHARLSDDAALLARLMPAGYAGRADRALLFTVAAWDSNCPQHIPRKLPLAEAAALLAARDDTIRALRAEIDTLRAARSETAGGSDVADREQSKD